MDRGIHQTVVSVAPGDAITNAALEIRALLRRLGPSEIYARNIHHDLIGDVRALEEYPRRTGSRALTIVHISIGDPDWLAFVLGLPGRFVLSHHNITPASYFEAWDPGLARLLQLGRSTLGVFRDRTVRALADSAYNASELIALGYRDVRVGGLVLDTESLLTVEPDPSVLPPADGPVVLAVGQLFPHKRPDLVLAAFHRVLLDHPDARLVLAGAARLPRFRAAIDHYVERLALTGHVTVTGGITVEQIAACYRSADVFVSASDHEGFCVPLVEAMGFGVPIVARACGAVPDTAGDAAVLVAPGDGPSVLAATVSEVLDDPEARAELRRRGHVQRRLAARDETRRVFLEAIEDVVSA